MIDATQLTSVQAAQGRVTVARGRGGILLVVQRLNENGAVEASLTLNRLTDDDLAMIVALLRRVLRARRGRRAERSA